MLLELKVNGFAIIDSLQVRFLRPGLNVLSGETGAGKSILLKSLGLLLGGKAPSDIIRSGHEQAVIEGSFDLSDRSDIRAELKALDLDSGDNNLVVRRIISQQGRHRLYINGHLSTLNVLESIISRLVEITGQHEFHSLVKPQTQLFLLDRFANLLDLRIKIAEQFNKVKDIEKQIEELQVASKEREQKLDFLKFQITEIDSFNPSPGEDQDLQSRFQKARFSSKLLNYASKAESVLYSQDSSIHSLLSDLIREGDSLSELDSQFKPLVQSLKEAHILTEDVAFAFRNYIKEDKVDAEELEKLEERVSDFKKLQKKYGSTTDEIIEFRNKALAEYNKLEKNEESLAELKSQLHEEELKLQDFALEAHKKRSKAASKITDLINKELRDLNMKGTEFVIQVEKINDVTSTGCDDVTFLIKASAQDTPKSISRVASGGELSRLMLAIKQILVASDYPMTYLFDEVDAGVSGPTAEKVGRKLKMLGFDHQVICITHLPQVAAFADAHFLISKETAKGQVKSDVFELDHKARVQELGRMISGEKVTSASLTHAKEMIESYKHIKKARSREL